MGKVGARSKPPLPPHSPPDPHPQGSQSQCLASLCPAFFQEPQRPLFPSQALSPSLLPPLPPCPFPLVSSQPWVAALGGALTPNSVDWKGEGYARRRVPQFYLKQRLPLLLALGVGVLGGRAGLLEWDLCVRGRWVRSRFFQEGQCDTSPWNSSKNFFHLPHPFPHFIAL